MMIDHYKILGLPSGEEGRNLTTNEIKKAYKLQALKLHPDKQLCDPNAVAKFQQLQFSYELLMKDETRKPFDDLWRQKEQLRRRQAEQSRQADVQSRRRQAAQWRQEDVQARRRQKSRSWKVDLQEKWRQARRQGETQWPWPPEDVLERWRREAHARTNKSQSNKSENNSGNVKSNNLNREGQDNINRGVDLSVYLKEREKRAESAMKAALKAQQERSAKMFQDEIAKAQAMRANQSV